MKEIKETIKTGIIGGSGLYHIQGVRIKDKITIETPFGVTSDKITLAEINGIPIAFLPRHGEHHTLLPSEIPSRANIWAMKSLGVEKILSISAVGSLHENIHPGDFVIPSQIIDRTYSRNQSFFGNGIVGHITFAEPFCPSIQKGLINAIESKGIKLHIDQTIICMEGPAFSTKAESMLYRQWDAGIIGMTVIPEAKLAREAEICYAMIAMVTDYDCWKENEESVSVEMVIKTMKNNQSNVNKILGDCIQAINKLDNTCQCNRAAENAIMTPKEYIPRQVKESLSIMYGKYW